MLVCVIKTDEKNVVDIVEKYISDAKAIIKSYEQLQTKLVKYEINELFENIDTVNGIKVLKVSFKDKSIDELKEIVDRGKEKLQIFHNLQTLSYHVFQRIHQ